MSEISETLDITSLIQNNPLTKITSDYGSQILEKIIKTFPTKEQQWFIANLYLYLNYDEDKDYIVDLENIRKLIGFTKKVIVKDF